MGRGFFEVFRCVLVVLSMAPMLCWGGLSKAFDNKKVQEAVRKNIVYKVDLAAVMVFRDEAPYLKEWLEYHKLIGFQRFYLYNNLSLDGYLEVLEPYLDSGEVVLVDWPEEATSVDQFNHFQCTIYKKVMKRAVHDQVKWLAIFDADEFIVPAASDNLAQFLSDYEGVGGVCVKWVLFGTSGVSKIPQDRLLIETLLLNGGGSHDHVKSIVRPERVVDMKNAHRVVYGKRYRSVDIPVSVMQMNHYWTRDEYYLHAYKIPRRLHWGTSPETTLSWARAQNHDTPYGKTILRFVEPLRQVMGLDDEN